MVVGMPNAGQVNALETLNIRGERSVTCKGAFDAHPSTGALPTGAPAECEEFRKLPDALEYAAELDAKYGSNPDLAAMPLYCTAMSFKAVYDAKDMRSIGGGDVNYATDFAPQDSTLVARLRASGAIIYAKAHNAEYNGGAGDPGGAAEIERPMLGQTGARESWGGPTCNPYDTTRETGGSSGGSGASVAANLVVCSICESTGGSCRSPGTHNGVVTFVPTKGMISYGGGIGANPWHDRPGISCRTVEDAAMVFESFRDKETGTFFDARDIYTALPRPFTSKESYVSALSDPNAARPLAGTRIGVPREMLIKSTPGNAVVIDTVDRELKVLASLGAQIVEITGAGLTDDPAYPNAAYTFEHAIAEVVPYHLPEILSWKKADGTPEFAVPGYDVTSRAYLAAAASLKAPWPSNLNFVRMLGGAPATEDSVSGYHFALHFAEYLLKRGDKRVYDWATLNANAKYFSDVRRTAMKNWENKPVDVGTDVISYTIRRAAAMRLAIVKVLEQNDLDVFVTPPTLTLPTKIGGSAHPDRGSYGYGARMGLPEVFVPAGFAAEVYDPTLVLNEDGTEYERTAGATPAKPASPLPFNIGFWAGPGEEPLVLKVASAYEAATHHRKAPPGFGPVRGTYQSQTRTD
jgi:Asp-tRNA(Asn)/Glu-tRNA(Gln) amidotransferase A subunit family amidase